MFKVIFFVCVVKVFVNQDVTSFPTSNLNITILANSTGNVDPSQIQNTVLYHNNLTYTFRQEVGPEIRVLNCSVGEGRQPLSYDDNIGILGKSVMTKIGNNCTTCGKTFNYNRTTAFFISSVCKDHFAIVRLHLQQELGTLLFDGTSV